jgi:hypothetical protein
MCPGVAYELMPLTKWIWICTGTTPQSNLLASRAARTCAWSALLPPTKA